MSEYERIKLKLKNLEALRNFIEVCLTDMEDEMEDILWAEYLRTILERIEERISKLEKELENNEEIEMIEMQKQQNKDDQEEL